MAKTKAGPVAVVDSEGNPLPHVQDGGTVTVLGNDENGETIEPEDYVDPFTRAAQELGASGDYGRVEIYRVKRTLSGPLEAFVGPMSLEEFNYVEVQRRYGGGEFRFRLKDGNGRIKKQVTQTFEGEPIVPRQPSSQQVVQSHESRSEGNETLMRALGAIMEQNNALLTEIRNSRQTPQKSTLEIAQELAALKALFSDGPRPDPFQMFTQTIGLIKETGLMEGAGGGGATTEMDLFKTLIEKFGPAFMAGIQKDQNAAIDNPPAIPFNPHAGMATQTASPPVSVAPIRPNPNPPAQADPQMMQLKMALRFLCVKAVEGGDADLYADLVMDNASDEELRALFSSPQWLEQLASVFPDVRNHSAWFAKLKAAIETRLTEEAEAGDPSADETTPE